MKSDRPVRSLRAACMLTGLIALGGTLSAAPASAATGPDLQLTASVPAGPHVIGEEIPVALTITNIGDTTATGVKVEVRYYSGTYPGTNNADLAEFNPQTAGGTLAAGKSRTVTLRTTFGGWTGTPEVVIGIIAENDVDYGNNDSPLEVNLVSPEVKDIVAGSVYGDADGDGKPSPGEALAGVRVEVGYTGGLTATTDADGKFVVRDVPAGMQPVGFVAPSGWQIPYYGLVKVDGTGANTGLLIRAVRPLDETLHATLTLDKDSYPNSGAQAKITVKLENTGDRAISGIRADCAAFEATLLRPTSQAWGVLGSAGPGATLQPHTSATFKAIATVSMKSAATGRTGLGCFFGPAGSVRAPYSFAGATVPGKKAIPSGTLADDKNENGVIDPGELAAGVKAELYQEGSSVTYSATSDAAGKLVFPTVAVGDYTLRVLGPWRIIGGGPGVHAYAVPFADPFTMYVVPQA